MLKSDSDQFKFNWKVSIRANMFVLKILGMWPKGNEGYKFDAYTLYSISMNILLHSENIFQTIYMFITFTDLKAVASIIFILFTAWLDSVKVFLFVRNIKLLKKLMKDLDCAEFQPTQSQKGTIQPLLNLWKMVAGTFGFILFWALVTRFMFPILDGSFKEHRLPLFAWHPFNTNVFPWYEITYLYQVICIWFLAASSWSVDMLVVALMTYTVAQCNILCDNLKNLDSTNYDYNQKLICCIKHHQKIVRFANNSNMFFNEIVLGQFFTSSISLGLTMFLLTLVAPLSSEGFSLLLYVVDMAFQIFLYCWFGNEVEEMSSRIPYAAFESDWTGIPLEAKKNLLIFILRTQKPITMSAINLFTLSLSTFTTILRTSWSYFAVLRQVNGQD